MAFAENLRELLDFKDIELKELSAGTGISKNTLDNYLSGQKSIPNAENAVKIAAFLGTSVEFLVTGKSMSEDKEINSIVANLRRLNEQEFLAIKNIISALVK